MQVTVENSGGLQRKLTVQVPGNEVQQKIDARLREIGKTAKLKGFRPGKIPMKVLQQRYGASVQREILGQTMQDSLQRAIQQEALRLVANPVVDRMPQLRADQDLEFTATLEVYPEVKDIAVKAISLASPETEVTDADIDDMLQTLREQRGSWKLVERSPKDKDHVTFEYSAELADSRFPEEGVKKMSLLMGSSDLDKMEKKLSGMAVDEESEVKQKFPAEFPEKALAGQAAKLSVKLIGVRERNVPELDDEFIKSFSIESGSIDELRTEVRANLERELTGARATYLKMQLLDELLKAQADLAVPESLVREEATAMAQAEARQQGQEQVSKQRVEALLNSARKRVKSGILISEIARQNNILVDGARVRKTVETVAETYEQPREVVQLYYSNPELLRSVEVSVLEDQVVDWVLKEAKVTPKAMSFKDLINAATQSRQGV
jgi:trigger factor